MGFNSGFKGLIALPRPKSLPLIQPFSASSVSHDSISAVHRLDASTPNHKLVCFYDSAVRILPPRGIENRQFCAGYLAARTHQATMPTTQCPETLLHTETVWPISEYRYSDCFIWLARRMVPWAGRHVASGSSRAGSSNRSYSRDTRTCVACGADVRLSIRAPSMFLSNASITINRVVLTRFTARFARFWEMIAVTFRKSWSLWPAGAPPCFFTSLFFNLV